MAVCRFCKEEMAPEATRCPRCTSFLDGEKTPVIPGKVVYVLDSSLVTFLKYAGTILAIFLTVALSFYSLDLKKLGEAVSTTHAESQKLDISIKQAQFDLEKQKAELEKQKKSVIENVVSAQAAAASASKSSEDAAAILGSIHHTQEQAEQSGRQIEEYRIRFIVPQLDAPENPRIESNSVRLDKTIEAKVLQILKMTLPASQYAAVESKLKSAETTGLRRRIFDARNETNLPGALMRSEGDAPIADPLVDQVYDRLGTVHTFFKEVVGRDISDDANGLTVTIHYDRYYNNGFWDGQQLTIGDGDGKVFKEDLFSSLSVLTGELSHAVIQKTSKLTYAGQSGALNSSFSDVSAVLIEQWMSRQPAEKASWLVAPGIFIAKGTAKALRSLKEPDSDTVAAPQVAHMSKFSDAADVHENSGIPSKAFYEMATRLKGFAWERPAKIWYEAYWTLDASSKFQDLADATVRVATRLYGARSPERTAVVQSWAVVGIVTGK